MTKAKHFFTDYPDKCKSILEENLEEDRCKDREITHMLALANGIIIVPYERLQENGFSGDDKQYPESAKKLKDVLKGSFNDSYLFEEIRGNWFYDQWDGDASFWEAKSGVDVRQSIEAYDQNKSEKQPITVHQIISHLRNALAHANIYFLPFEDSNEIEYIVFLSKKRTKISKDLKNASTEPLRGLDDAAAKYLIKLIDRAMREDERCAYLMTSPESFRKFLNRWAALVESISVQPVDLSEIYGEAAD